MTTTEVVITQRITVDSEIADEIVALNAAGVRTEGSCSGHGITKPTAMITPSSAEPAQIRRSRLAGGGLRWIMGREKNLTSLRNLALI